MGSDYIEWEIYKDNPITDKKEIHLSKRQILTFP